MQMHRPDGRDTASIPADTVIPCRGGLGRRGSVIGGRRQQAGGAAQHLSAQRPDGRPAPPGHGSQRQAALGQGRPGGRVRTAGAVGHDRRVAERFRDALVAVDPVGLSYREAGSLLDTPEATITTRLFRARQRIARSLSAAAS